MVQGGQLFREEPMVPVGRVYREEPMCQPMTFINIRRLPLNKYVLITLAPHVSCAGINHCYSTGGHYSHSECKTGS